MRDNTNEPLSGGRTKDSKFNFGKKGWRLVIIALLSYAVYMGFDNGLNFIAPAYSEILGVNQTALMFYSTTGGWLSVLAIIVFGLIQKRAGCKKILIITLIGSIFGGLVWANAANLAMYGIGAVVTKTMGTVFTMLCFAEIGSNWFPTKKGNYMGMITVGVVVGGFLANGPVGSVIRAEGPQKGIMMLVLLNVVVLVLSAIFVKNFPEEAGANPDNDKDMTPEQAKAILNTVKEYQRSSKWTVSICLRNRTVWMVGISFGLLLCIAQGLMAQTVSAVMSMGHSAGLAQLASVSCAPFAFVSTIITGKMDQKYGTKRVAIVIFMLAIIACLLGGFGGKIVPGILISIWLVTAAVSGGNNLIMSMVSTIWGRVDFSGPYMVALMICQLISAFGYIVISGLANLSPTYIYAFVGGAVIIFVGLIVVFATSDKMLGRTKDDVVAGTFGTK